MENTGSRIRELREYYRLTQGELAKKVNTTKAAVSNYERGERYPKPEILDALCDVFNVDMNFLTGRDDHTDRLLTLEEVKMIDAFRVADPSTRAAVLRVLNVEPTDSTL